MKTQPKSNISPVFSPHVGAASIEIIESDQFNTGSIYGDDKI